MGPLETPPVGGLPASPSCLPRPWEHSRRVCTPGVQGLQGLQCSPTFPLYPSKGFPQGNTNRLWLGQLPPGLSEWFRAAQGGAEWSRRHERGGRCAYEGLGKCVWLSHCPSFSRLPDTSALGQILGRRLAGLPPSHGARAAKQAGSSHWFLDHGQSRCPTQIYDALNLAGASQTAEAALALDQNQPMAGEVESLGQEPAGGQALSACSALAPHKGSLWRALLVPPSGPPGFPRALCRVWASPSPSVTFSSGHSSLGDCPRLQELLHLQSQKYLEVSTPNMALGQ